MPKHILRFWFFALICALPVLPRTVCAVGVAADHQATDDDAAIEQRLAATARYLSSDELEGRGLETHGIELAAQYIAAQFRQLGLRTNLCEGTPFQKFTVTTDAELGPSNRLVLLGPANEKGLSPATALEPGRDYTPVAAGDSVRFDLPLVFVGYGITEQAPAYDDYAGLKVTGKAVVILRHEPQVGSASAGTLGASHGVLRHKISNAYAHGAAAVVFCTDHAHIEQKERHQELLLRMGTADVVCSHRGLPVLHCRRAFLEPAIRTAYGTDLATVEAMIQHDFAPHSRELNGWRIAGRTDIRRIESPAKNVVAMLPGRGAIGQQSVILGAHYDHFGFGRTEAERQAKRAIYSGADDNASGVAAMLEIARRLTENTSPLARQVVFVAFSGEEHHLSGSKYFVNHPVVPLRQAAAMVNLDMVGRLRDDRLYVRGSFTVAGCEELLRTLDARHGLILDLSPDNFGRSDQLAFYAKQVPILHFFTGRHEDYHETSDKFEKLNISGMRRVTGLVEDVVLALADAPTRPECLAVVPHDDEDPYFGAMGDFTRPGPGVAIATVAKDGPAEKAGLRAGDLVIQLDDNRIANVDDFNEALTHYGGPQHVRVLVKRAGQPKTFDVELAPSHRE